MRRANSTGLDERIDILTEEIKKRTKCDEKNFKDLKHKLSHFKFQYATRWKKANRMDERFLQNNQSWLDASISFLLKKETKRGRPETSFDFCSERTKRLKTKDLRETNSLSALAYATQMSLRAQGNPQASKIVKEITTLSPERANKYKEAYKKSLEPQKVSMNSGEDALSVLVDAKLSRNKYEIVREKALEKFPSYKVVQTTKKMCYPKSIEVTDTCASVPLQELLDHTMERLVLVTEPII